MAPATFNITYSNASLSDFSLGLIPTNSLYLDQQRLNSFQTVLTQKQIKDHSPFTLFFEGLRTNNTFVNKPNQYLLVSLFKLANSAQTDFCFVKLKHSNKSHCESAGRWYINFLASLIQVSNNVEIEYAVVKAEEIKTLDAFNLKFKSLYLANNEFYGIDVNSTRYRDFLDYYTHNKVKSD